MAKGFVKEIDLPEDNMAKINIKKLAEFDSAAYLTSKVAIAAYLTDIIQANDSGLLADAMNNEQS